MRKLLSDPYVLFLVTAAMYFDRSKIPKPALCRIPYGTFITSLVLIGQVMSEKKSLKKNVNDDRQTVMDAKWWQ